jgi:cell wall-associated NlpC family hydrolase
MPPTYVLSPSDGKPMPYFDKLMKVALQFQGMPYQWGGHIPATSFDCSGLVEYSFAQIGINMPRTAQEQYNATKRISKEQLQPGDLVFFTKTYDGAPFISHVGIYVGDNKMYNSNSKGISYSDLTSKKWTEHLVGFGRIGGF